MTSQQEPTLEGWYFEGPGCDGSIPDELAGIRPAMRHNGKPVAYLRSVVEDPEPITVLYQAVSTAQYRGKRVRFSADLLNAAGTGARLWLRVIPNGGAFNYAFGYFDATDDWQRGEIVVDVDERAEAIMFGAGVWDQGEVWMSGASFEVVDDSVPVTCQVSTPNPREPLNLTFEG